MRPTGRVRSDPAVPASSSSSAIHISHCGGVTPEAVADFDIFLESPHDLYFSIRIRVAMTRSLNRRDFLKSTGGGVVGATLVSTQVSAISPSSDVLWADDFESSEPGDEPDGVVMAGNDDQEVVDEVSASGAQSYRLSGSHGGCWRAIARFPFDVESEMVFRGHFKVGS